MKYPGVKFALDVSGNLNIGPNDLKIVVDHPETFIKVFWGDLFIRIYSFSVIAIFVELL